MENNVLEVRSSVLLVGFLQVEGAPEGSNTSGQPAAPQMSNPREDFHSAWGISDFVLTAQAEGGELRGFHCHKQMLALHSPFFQAMFCGSFPMENEAVFHMQGIHPDAVMIMLKTIYLVYYDFGQFSPEGLHHLLLLGDQYDFPLIRALAVDGLMHYNEPLNQQELVGSLDLMKQREEALTRLDLNTIRTFLRQMETEGRVVDLSLKEVNIILSKTLESNNQP